MTPEVHHDLELGHQRLDVGDVRLGLDHLDGHCGHRLPGHDAAGLRLQDAAKGAGAEKNAEIESVSGKLEIPKRMENMIIFSLSALSELARIGRS